LKTSDLDRIGETYHASSSVPDKHIEDICQQYSAKWILNELLGATRVLEMGYGDGIITRALVEGGKAVTVLEGSKFLSNLVGAEMGGQVECCNSMFETFSPTGEKFDAIVASHVLEHVDDPVGLLIRMKNWLVDQGKIVVVVPNCESIHRRLAVNMNLQPQLDSLSDRDRVVGHQRVYSYRGLEKDLRGAGYAISSSTGFFLKPFSNSMMLSCSVELLHAMNHIANEIPKELLANIGVAASVHS